METPAEKIVEGYKTVRNGVILIILALIVVICVKSVEYNKLYNEYDLLKSQYQNLQEEFETYKENIESREHSSKESVVASHGVYHSLNCPLGTGTDSFVVMTLDEAVSAGYAPCDECNP